MEADDEDDAPPMLVAAGGTGDPAEAALNADLEGVKITKVPITIITGRLSVALTGQTTASVLSGILSVRRRRQHSIQTGKNSSCQHTICLDIDLNVDFGTY